MRSPPVMPYRVLPAAAVVMVEDGWMFRADGHEPCVLRDGDPFIQWDAQLIFELERTIRLNPAAFREIGVFGTESVCDIVVIGTSSGGLSRELLARVAVPPDGVTEIRLTVHPPSQRLSGDLVLTTGIVLSRDLESSKVALGPTHAGSRLWEVAERIRLEGGAARLPLYEVPFSRAFPGERIAAAEFHVEVGDPELPIEAALTVWINAERPAFVKELRKPQSPVERRLWNAVLRRVVATAALGDWESYCLVQEPGSLGEAVQRWATQIWPAVPLRDIHKLPVDEFSMFEASIEAWADRASGASPAEVNA